MSSIESKGQIPAEELERIKEKASSYDRINYGWSKKNHSELTTAAYVAGAKEEYLRAQSLVPIQLKEGDKAVLDKQFNNASVVTVKRLGKHLATVSSEGASWDVVAGRLSVIMPNPEELPLQPIKEPAVEMEKKYTRSELFEICGGWSENLLQVAKGKTFSVMDLSDIFNDWLDKNYPSPPSIQQEAIPDQPSNVSDIAYVFRSRIRALQSELSALREEKSDLEDKMAGYKKTHTIMLEDVREASEELMIDVPEPGTDMAKVMRANAIMRRQRDSENNRASELGELLATEKAEKEEYRKALREIYNGESSKHHTYEDRLGPKDMAIIAMRVLDKFPPTSSPINPDKSLILTVLKWALDNHVSRAGKYWGKDYSNIAYDDDGIVREYLQSLTPNTQDNE